MVRAGAVALFAAQGHQPRVEQVTKKLPAGGRLKAGEAQVLGHPVDRGGTGHGAGHATQAGLVGGYQPREGGQHSQAVGGRDHEVPTNDHVAVGIAIGGGAHVWRIGGIHLGDQVGCVDRVRVRVQSTEVLTRLGVDHRARRRTQLAFQQGAGVGPAHRPHGVQAQAEARSQQAPDGVEIKQAAHQVGVVSYRVNYLHRHALQRQDVQGIQRQVGAVAGVDGLQLQASLVDGLGQRLGRRAAVGHVVLDAEVALRAAGVVAGRQHDAAAGAMAADHGADRRGRQDAALPHQHPGVALGSGQPQDALDRHPVVVAAIAPDHQGLAGGGGQNVKQGLHKIFQVQRLLEHRHFFAQAGGAGSLAGVGLGAQADQAHGGAC